MKQVLILYLFLLPFISFSQINGDFTLDWQNKKEMSFGDSKLKIPYFSGNSFRYDTTKKSIILLLNLTESGYSNYNSIQIFNVIYESVSTADLGDLSLENIPEKPISEYRIGLFESEQAYTITLVGVNTYENGEYTTVIQIEFKPTNMYFALPESYFRNSTREQLLDKLCSELKDFTSTEKFKASFLTKGDIGVFETTGEIIWSNTDSSAK